MATSATAHAPRPPHGPPHSHRVNGSPRRRSADGQVMGVLLMVFGLGWLLRVAGAIEMGWESLLSVVLIVLGVGMAITARARTGGILMVLGIFLTISLATTSSVGEIDMGRGVGERRIAVQNVSELQPSYRLFAGDFTLDMAELTLPAERTRTVEAGVTFGELTVVLPPDVSADVTVTVRAGEVDRLGRRSGGTRLEEHFVVDGSDDAGRLVLDLSVGFGEVRVIQATAPPPDPGDGDAPR